MCLIFADRNLLLFLLPDGITGTTRAGCPAWSGSLTGKTALTKNNNHPQSKGKKEKILLTRPLDLDSLQLHENVLGTWWHMDWVMAYRNLFCRMLGKRVRA